MAYKECEQYKCAFRSRPDDCPVCPECGAGPCVVSADGNCVNCWSCEHDDGYVRKGLSKNTQKALVVIGQVVEQVERKLNDLEVR